MITINTPMTILNYTPSNPNKKVQITYAILFEPDHSACVVDEVVLSCRSTRLTNQLAVDYNFIISQMPWFVNKNSTLKWGIIFLIPVKWECEIPWLGGWTDVFSFFIAKRKKMVRLVWKNRKTFKKVFTFE